MQKDELIDINYDFRADSGGKDPDRYSATLRRYHKLLWSKSLPSGKIFNLDDNDPRYYLKHTSELGSFYLSSDSVIPTFSKWKRLQYIIGELPENEVEDFLHIAYTIGGMLVFPSNKIDGKPSINMERGYNPKIVDRLDLTLECIRRHYIGGKSPLSETLSRYSDFFNLFVNFKGYVDFFLLNDLVNDDYSVKFLLAFDDFRTTPLPKNIAQYKTYREATIEFLKLRNQRIKKFVTDISLVLKRLY